tara:strand:+ start:3051 stop:4106 length:1056 start_codon:yes stop_codon:yes gene_type:complete
MDQTLKNSIVHRIVSGIFYINIEGNIYKYTNPNKEQLALSEYIYEESLSDSKYNGLLTRDALKSYLQRKDIWNDKDDQKLKDFNDLMEDLKIQLYNSLYRQDKQKIIRRNIKNLEKQINKQLMKKYTLDNMTLEYHAEAIKYRYLISLCISDLNNVPVYETQDFKLEKDFSILNNFMHFFDSNTLSSNDYREIARTEPFRNLWSLSDGQVYKTEPIEWSADQKTLIIYSKMYDNVYEHPERPDSIVINDDDMLDGWFAKTRKDNESERKKQQANSIHDKHGGRGDLFIMSPDRETADEVLDLNDIHARMKIKSRESALNEADRKLEHHELPDVKMELRTEAMRQMADRFKK